MVRIVSRAAFVLGLTVALGGMLQGKVKVRAERDKTFDFKSVRTWDWHPQGAGEVKMAITADDNPAAVTARFGPAIKDAIGKGLSRAKVTEAAEGAQPQLYVYYYLLLTTNQNRQTIGQFAPAVPEWGLPPFSGATQSLRVFEEGSLLVDATSAAAGTIVWRGIARAEVHRERTAEERETRLRAAIADLLEKFPKTS